MIHAPQLQKQVFFKRAHYPVDKKSKSVRLVLMMTIQENVSLHDKNWFGTGGLARYYCAPETAQDFAHALAYAQQQHVPIFLLGLGANILISDDGFQGLVIRPQLKKIIHHVEHGQALVTAGAGVTIHELITYCLDHNLIGLEDFSGIPGTVGGSVFINIHYFKHLFSDFILEAQIIEQATGTITTVDRSWFNFGYDHSRLHDQTHYVVQATFRLNIGSEAEAAYARGRSDEIIRHRLSRYPIKGTCGCFFRNFNDNEVTLMSNGKKMTYSSYYFDKLGIKGELCHGGACVSYQHANMIVNNGTATSNDVITVARTMQQLVKDRYGITPQPECQLIGFKDYPLL